MRRRRMPLGLLLIAALAMLPASLPLDASSGTAEPAAGSSFLRGMTVSCPGIGRIWGTEAMAEALSELSGLGVEWVAIHPYARIGRDGRVGAWSMRQQPHLERAVEMARAAGVQLFWKPHLAYWGSFSWRGEIEFGSDEAVWGRFFEQYRDFIVEQARFAQSMEVPVFAVGVELEATTHREAEWRRVIAEVRKVYRGKITYAANWDRLNKVPFWDAVDWIGVQAYFPLSEADAPSQQELERGWDGPLNELRQLSDRLDGKEVLFAEIGYDLGPDIARRPWAGGWVDTQAHRKLRRRLFEVALERLEDESMIRGMFWWKWMPGRYWRGDFSMRDPDAKEILRRYWGGTTPAAGAP